MSSPFPLPLTTIERFFVHDDQPGYPNHVICRLRCDGYVNDDAALRSLDDLWARHPMIGVRLKRRRSAWCWIHDDTTGPTFESMSIDPDLDFPELEPFDLEKGPCFRMLVVHRGDSTDVIFQVHHACMDGIGGMQTLRDWILIYDQQVTGDKHKLPRLDAERLLSRGKFVHGLRDWLRKLPQQMIGAYGAYKYWIHRAVPLQSEPNVAPRRTAFAPCVLTHTFTAKQSIAFQRLAETADATVNGLLARDLFLALDDWLDEKEIDRKGKYLRLMVPLNMRTFADRRLSVTNRVSMVYLDRGQKDIRDPAGLLWGVNFEVKTIQRLHLGLTWLMFTKLIQWIPGGLRRQVKADVCRSTCIFTNIGDPLERMRLPRKDGRLQFGNIQLESLDLLAPLRPKTGAALSVYRYAGRTRIALHYDRWSIDRADAQTLLDRYVARTLKSIASKKNRRTQDPVTT